MKSKKIFFSIIPALTLLLFSSFTLVACTGETTVKREERAEAESVTNEEETIVEELAVELTEEESESQKTEAEIEAECIRKVSEQKNYLKNETLGDTETFEKYKVDDILQVAPADLNVSSNKFAREFRTRICEELATQGVNFAGSYSIVSVGMTGWGENYYIVDRRNGNAYIFPYYAAFLDFRKDSNLIIMNPKEAILDAMSKKDDLENCYWLHQQEFTDLRPFYFLWENNQLILIGPHDIQPPPNQFWTGYFGEVLE
ncbi:hypothetical protein KKG48_04550 [Patescibacteria group bacterium]|nr:hypothetical protein [Patescibacteria group bacterium]